MRKARHKINWFIQWSNIAHWLWQAGRKSKLLTQNARATHTIGRWMNRQKNPEKKRHKTLQFGQTHKYAHTISGIYVWQYPTHIQFISYNAVRMPCRRWMVDIDGFTRIEEWNIFWTTASTRKRSGIGVGSIPPNVIIFIMLHTSYAHQFIQTPYYIRKDWYMPFTVVWQICTLNTTYAHTTINSWR